MKTQEEYIEAVKVKLEEISPFKEPDEFIASDDSSANSVKPIISYIDQSLDEAAHNCLRSLPLSLLHADIERKTDGMSIDVNGVGIIIGINATYRYVRFHHSALEHDITAFITSESPIYLLQQNTHTRGGQAKPVAVVASYHDGSNAGQMEIYSFPSSDTEGDYVLLYIDTEKNPASDAPGAKIQSPIDDLIVLECARIVFNILGNADGAKRCLNDFTSKVQSIIQ